MQKLTLLKPFVLMPKNYKNFNTNKNKVVLLITKSCTKITTIY